MGRRVLGLGMVVREPLVVRRRVRPGVFAQPVQKRPVRAGWLWAAEVKLPQVERQGQGQTAFAVALTWGV
jgi:hypothetical protein